jgi:uncharacterized protein YecT (DUF1311 family)
MIRVLWALVVLFVVVPAAQAASFDCGKAATSMERVICSHPDLSLEDEVLAQAYATALGGLSKPAADTLKAAQHAWLGYAERICSVDAQPIEGDYTDDQAQCLDGTFTSRVKALESSRMQGGFRFYPVDLYLVEQDTDATADSFIKVADKHFHEVKIDRGDDLASAFNAMVADMRMPYAQSGEGGAALLTGDGLALTTGDVGNDVEVTTTVKDVTSRRITLRTDEYSYGHGAAHGNYATRYRHFLIAEKRPLEASDIFAGPTWQKTLGKLVLDRLEATIDGGVWEEAKADVAGWAADPSRWDFSDKGLIVQFQPYEVTAYAGGVPTALIPWDDLRAIMSEDAEAIATY